MHVLIVKTSSLGDVIHTLPAVSDACRAVPGIRFDWVAEERLAEIPAWHPGVERVIPIALRRWRRQPWRALRGGEWRRFVHILRERRYDRVIDAQGLIKSAWVTRLARLAPGARRCGLDRASAREPLAALAYGERHEIARGLHAVTRVRILFARCLGYPPPADPPDFGLDPARFAPAAQTSQDRYLVFLHGTSWPSKLWPEECWIALARQAAAHGYGVRLPWGDAAERQRAERIAAACDQAQVLDRMDLTAMAALLSRARGVVAVDTGLSHLAAALAVPTVALYGSTRPGLTGTVGARQRHLTADFPCSPCLARACRYAGRSRLRPACYESLPPELVWHALSGVMAEAGAMTIERARERLP